MSPEISGAQLIQEHAVHPRILDGSYLDAATPPSPKPRRHEEEKQYGIPSASLEILRSHTSKFGKVNEKKMQEMMSHDEMEKQLSVSPLSTQQIIEMAAVNFIQSCSGISALSHPYAASIVDPSNAEDVQLLQDLLSCAERVSNHQYLHAARLLAGCRNLSSGRTNVIKRVVYYFAEALSDKIDRETGNMKTQPQPQPQPPLEPASSTSALSAFHQQTPLHQPCLFAAIQEIVHHVSYCKKVHIIDLEMRCGLQHVILMQALAARPASPLKHLKITAVAVYSSRSTEEEAGGRLKAFAKSLNLNLSFHMIKLEEMLNTHHRRNLSHPDEKTVVYASNALKFMIAKPTQLESLMRVIRNINPCVMIVCEPEGNVNSPVFVNRFVEALFFYGAYFDCVGDCMKSGGGEREFVEANLLSPLLRSTVAAEGEERGSRIVGIDVWRKFFAKFGMVERGMSRVAFDHANLVMKMLDCRHCCALGIDGNTLIVRWKGTPICSLSAWSFHKMMMLPLQT